MILRQTVTELCTSMPTAPVLRTLVQYLIALCSRLETASDVISVAALDPTGMDVLLDFVILGQTVLEISDCLAL